MQLNEDFIKQMTEILPPNEARTMVQSIEDQEPVVAVRVNDAKLQSIPDNFERVPWCTHGVYLNERPAFTFDPQFHAGCYYVQDPSSMFIYHVIKSLVKQPVKYLDLCAAPGGKTTAALQALPQGSIVVANEIVPPRAQVLRENVIKWGYDNCMVTCDNPKAFNELTNEFDVVATDVPCSGEGMFRKDDEAVAQWSPQLVQQCAQRQCSILADVWNALKPGGLLIYSTCTYNTHENEEIVDYIINTLGATAVDVQVKDSWLIHGAIGRNYPCYRFMPHMTRGEGLFMCVLRKNQNATALAKPAKKKSKSTSFSVLPVMRNWVSQNYTFSERNNIVVAVRKDIKEIVEGRFDKLHIIKEFGIQLGEIKGKKIIPSHQLAMSVNRMADAFPKCEVDYPTAIAYLRGEALTIDAPKGYVLITYHGATLGFANNLGNRANNLYPKSWRIMSTHAPQDAPTFL